jgi:hypothetical protein
LEVFCFMLLFLLHNSLNTPAQTHSCHLCRNPTPNSYQVLSIIPFVA